jgi:hypothetical protein
MPSSKRASGGGVALIRAVKAVEKLADFNSETHQVTVKAPAPAAAWDYTSDIGRRDFGRV